MKQYIPLALGLALAGEARAEEPKTEELKELPSPATTTSTANQHTLDAFLSYDAPCSISDIEANQIIIKDRGHGRCNGFAIGNGYILTAKHCISNPIVTIFPATSFYKLLLSGISTEARLMAFSQEDDIALLFSRQQYFSRPVSLPNSTLQHGDKIVAFPVDFIGAKNGLLGTYYDGNRLVLQGHVEALPYEGKRPRNRMNRYIAQFPTTEGFSGTPVFVERNDGLYLAGVVTSAGGGWISHVGDNPVMENTAFSGPDAIRQLLVATNLEEIFLKKGEAK